MPSNVDGSVKEANKHETAESVTMTVTKRITKNLSCLLLSLWTDRSHSLELSLLTFQINKVFIHDVQIGLVEGAL